MITAYLWRNRRFLVLILLISMLIYPSVSWAVTTDEQNNIDVYRKAAPAVVNITSTVVQRDFFYGVVPRSGSGSGVIIDSKGYILTNNHVIENAQRIEVTLSNGNKWPGNLVGTDSYNDLAVIRIDAPSEQLQILSLGSSQDLQVGQKVIAIGNPFGLQQTLTTGIISSLGRTIHTEQGEEMEDLIQTDAAINPGNSGGPLLDSDGKVIGINTAIFSLSGGSVGIGFAIPVDTVKRISSELIEKGYVSHPWIGATLFPLQPWLAEELNLKAEWGVMIGDVVRNGPADRAGLRGANKLLRVGNVALPIGGDVIVAFEGETVESTEGLVRMIRKNRPGDRVELKILRDNRFMEVPVVLGERPLNQ
ncbi:MAG: trypsin-like peptidase domain-containing protein [Deltaproteobacteria bacterium]|nr:trypsin-like peptidase domain-containing protein [Deltaproteobacteria bacterium]